ncbi:MYL7 isoform 1 [Pan troglodytes]|uniref:Myosin light chain 7 n=2 Tax=Homininae TaxID=207598 RepID=F8WD94_HUMAN|nr:MYL7 isoform 1 [Pan troglodytes]
MVSACWGRKASGLPGAGLWAGGAEFSVLVLG